MDPAISLNDGALLRRYAADGDPGAFAELVRRYAAMVYATARRVTGRGDIAEDVSQDCFLKMAERSGSITGSVAAWLHRTALNRSLELLRSEKSRKLREARVAEIAATAAADDSARPDADSAQLIAQVDVALAALPDELRVPLVEHYLCGRSQMELAAAMDVNQSTISRRIEKGLGELRRRLESAGAAAPLALVSRVLGEASTAPAPPAALNASLMKIAISGVGRMARRSIWRSPKAILTLGGAAAVVAMFVGALVYLNPGGMRGPRRQVIASPAATPASPAGALPPATTAAASRERGEREENVEIEGIMVEIPTADIPAAIKFYRDVLGFKLKFGDGKGYSIMAHDDEQIALLPKTPPFVGPTSCYVFVRNVDGYFAKVKANGGKINSPLKDSSYGMRDFSILDPEGNRISFGQSTPQRSK
jgi:RNA polymerase sigma-70 factor (ECF subfamily)